uniref:Uncharacterized protein n=1 Tax=Pyrodinium bahamense TaxID=73915 RepID=A0A7S0AQ92_9DINO
MASYTKGNVLMDSAVDEESNELGNPPRHNPSPRRWLWFGIAMVVAGAVGMAGVSQMGASPPPKRTSSPLSRLSMLQDGLTKAFTARALAGSKDFGAKFAVLLNEDGQPEPSAMGMTAKMEVGKDTAKWPKIVVTFLAQTGKGPALVKKLEDIWAGFLKLQADMNPDVPVDELKKLATIKAGEGDEAIFQIELPQGRDERQEDADLKAALQAQKPRLSAEVNVGRTIEEMYKEIDSNIGTLPHGISLKLDTAFASTIFDVVADLLSFPMDDPYRLGLKIMKGISMVKERVTILYKSEADLGDAFEDIPSLKSQMQQIAMQFQHGPPAVTGPMKGLDKLAKEIKSVVVEGLPFGWEVVATFRNFHPSPVISSMISGGSAPA